MLILRFEGNVSICMACSTDNSIYVRMVSKSISKNDLVEGFFYSPVEIISIMTGYYNHSCNDDITLRVGVATQHCQIRIIKDCVYLYLIEPVPNKTLTLWVIMPGEFPFGVRRNIVAHSDMLDNHARLIIITTTSEVR